MRSNKQVQGDKSWFRRGLFGVLAPDKVVLTFNSLFSQKSAFTLAEVLITLGIIGVVAAMTMPSLMNKIQNKHLVTALKKSYSVLSQATTMVQTENPITDWSMGNDLDSVRNFYEYYKPYLKLAKDCGCDTTQSGCWSKGGTKALNGQSYTYSHDGYIGDYTCSVILSDGTNIIFDAWYQKYLGINDNMGWTYFFFTDVNGNKKPNMLGRDVFTIAIEPKKGILIPAGMYNDSEHCNVSDGDSTFAGMDCTAKVLNDNKISY